MSAYGANEMAIDTSGPRGCAASRPTRSDRVRHRPSVPGCGRCGGSGQTLGGTGGEDARGRPTHDFS